MTKTALKTSRFGDITYEQEDVVVFEDGLVGMPEFREFVLIQHKEGSPFRWLQNVEDGSMALLVVDPSHYVDHYRPEMPGAVADNLRLSNETPILVYTVCTIPSGDPKAMTLNLAGPVVINAETRRALQVVLEDEDYPVRFPVFQKESERAA